MYEVILKPKIKLLPIPRNIVPYGTCLIGTEDLFTISAREITFYHVQEKGIVCEMPLKTNIAKYFLCTDNKRYCFVGVGRAQDRTQNLIVYDIQDQKLDILTLPYIQRTDNIMHSSYDEYENEFGFLIQRKRTFYMLFLKNKDSQWVCEKVPLPTKFYIDIEISGHKIEKVLLVAGKIILFITKRDEGRLYMVVFNKNGEIIQEDILYEKDNRHIFDISGRIAIARSDNLNKIYFFENSKIHFIDRTRGIRKSTELTFLSYKFYWLHASPSGNYVVFRYNNCLYLARANNLTTPFCLYCGKNIPLQQGVIFDEQDNIKFTILAKHENH